MLQIRPDQMQVFLDYVRETFTARVVTYLRADWKDATSSMDDAALRDWTRRQIDAAESYGITTEAPVVKFIEVALTCGEEFHSSGTYPEAERILMEETDALTKVETLRASARRNFEV